LGLRFPVWGDDVVAISQSLLLPAPAKAGALVNLVVFPAIDYLFKMTDF
jgi:hypothetical protein